MESWFFLCKFYALSICCFSLSLSLSSQNLHVTPWEIDQVQCFISIFWYSALHCAGEQSIHIFQDSWQTTIRHFSPSAIGITKTSPILSQQCGMNILFHIHSLMSFQTSTTDIISFMDHRRWYFDFMMVFLSKKTMNRGFQTKKKIYKIIWFVSYTCSFGLLLWCFCVLYEARHLVPVRFHLCRTKHLWTYFKIQSNKNKCKHIRTVKKKQVQLVSLQLTAQHSFIF